MEWSSTAKHFVGNNSCRRIVWVFDHFVGSGLKRLGCEHWDPLFLLLLSRSVCAFSVDRGGMPVCNLGRGCWGGCTAGGVQFPFLASFVLELARFSFLGGGLGAKL